MKIKKVLPFLTVAVVATGLVCGTMAVNAETAKTETVTNVFDSTSFEAVSHAMDCNQDGIVNVYDMTMLLDFLHCKEDAVSPNVTVNQQIVDSVGKEINTRLAEEYPEMLTFVTEKDIYVDTLSMTDIENAFEYSSSASFPAVVTLKLSKNLTLEEIGNIISIGNDADNIMSSICRELEQENGEVDFLVPTSYNAIRVVLHSHVENDLKVTNSHIVSVVPVKNGDMTGTVITNTDNRIAAVKQYLGMMPQVLAMASDYTVSDDAGQNDETHKFSRVTVKFPQPVQNQHLRDMLEYESENLSEYIYQYMQDNGLDTDENVYVTEISFVVGTNTETSESYLNTESFVPTLICK